MDKQLETRLKLLVSFPSPPGVAQQIILLANDPDVQISAVAQTISSDPGLAAKVLRIANSALYARRRRSDNLRQALTALGLGAVTTLALGFSIAPFFRKGDATGLDYNRCWRRALMGALAARDELSFSELKELFQVSDGNLSAHARKLEEAGYVSCTKSFAERRPRTAYRLTASGRAALNRYLDHVEAVIRATRGR